MKVTFLGTGTSQGVPFIGCDCAVCTSPDARNNRLRTSVLIQSDTTTVVIDSGPDFRQQMLRQGVKKLDAIVFTHGHKDHVAGMDDVRAFNFHDQKAMQVYADLQTQEVLKREFQYVFQNLNYPGIPQVDLNTIDGYNSFKINDLEFLPIRVLHYKMEVLGFRIGDFTYITDANYIELEEMNKAKGSKGLVLNALRYQDHPSHFTLPQAIDVATAIGANDAYFTHISHQLGLHNEVEKTLPQGMHLAYDGLSLEF
ncbi:MBL fold metallo-hydrolase [Chitinophagaceae bacterium IBVUCB1]|nr:MBL fold metallo-hydrolase [Chitinophagaceae bacterium IBVUCB1]